MGVGAWFAAVHAHRDKLLKHRDELGATVFTAIEALQARAAADPAIRSDMRQPLRGADRPRATNVLLRVLIADLGADRALPPAATFTTLRYSHHRSRCDPGYLPMNLGCRFSLMAKIAS
jgi:hypothetical protein